MKKLMMTLAAAIVAGVVGAADYSLLDNVRFGRSGGSAETVVWGKNPGEKPYVRQTPVEVSSPMIK